MQVTPKGDFPLEVPSCNIRTENGRRAAKSQYIQPGEKLDVVREFQSSGLATHGDLCYELHRRGYTLYVLAYEMTVVDP